MTVIFDSVQNGKCRAIVTVGDLCIVMLCGQRGAEIVMSVRCVNLSEQQKTGAEELPPAPDIKFLEKY